MSLTQVDVNEALGVLNGCLKDAAECMKKDLSITKNINPIGMIKNTMLVKETFGHC